MSEESDEPRAIVRRRRRWSSVWVVPIVALLVAGWLVWKNYHDKGPLVFVTFETADSIVAGTTEVRCRSVRIGMVERIDLAPDLQSVIVELRIEPKSEDLLRKNSRLWVVKPRISTNSISGIGTIFSGSYIELEPGDGPANTHHYQGLEEPPVTSSNIPGLRLTLISEEAGSLSVGSPIYYRGFEVGRVERRTLDIKNRRIRFDVFIEDDYASLVKDGTCFWNTSGIDVTAGADGFKLSTPSFQAMVSGGASFAVPKGGTPGNPILDGAVFTLYPDESEARKSVFKPDHRCLVFFDQSVRGLTVGAPVEYRGIQIGRVDEISFDYSPLGDSRVPVLIEIDTSTLNKAVEDVKDEGKILAESVRRGLRATLSTGSLLTGALYIDLDFASNPFPAELSRYGDFDVIPTESSGLARLQDKVDAILAKIEALPLEETLTKFGNTADEITITVKDLRGTLSEAEGALAEARELLARDETQNLTAELDATLKEVRASVASLGPEGAMQGDLARTLDELRAALRSFKVLSDSIEEKPNSLLFGREGSGDPIPRAKR
ncbi:intermembrane transport protein PqiB [Luteolibacter marinus]|uniref:intermembrane transport protein PqiB n=1 Tax=Luteolibacter marinus TaxID=2776705 RepID=UPI0018670156|nr:intermembrane transport protein PqiB [Luteolibacter marinus]